MWSYSAWQYIPSTFSSNSVDQFAGSYFILMNQFPVDANPENDEWSIQMQFDSNDGMLKVYYGNGLNTINIPYDTDRWVKIQAVIDLNENWTRIYYDDSLVAEYQWTGGVLGGGEGNLDISAVDLFANGASSVYYDDLKLEQIYPVPACGEPGIVKLNADLNRDLFVTLPDLMLFASFWLEGISLSDIFPTCDDGSVDLFDYSWFAQQWQQCMDPTNPVCIHKPLTLKEPPSRSINLALPQPCGDICTRG